MNVFCHQKQKAACGSLMWFLSDHQRKRRRGNRNEGGLHGVGAAAPLGISTMESGRAAGPCCSAPGGSSGSRSGVCRGGGRTLRHTVVLILLAEQKMGTDLCGNFFFLTHRRATMYMYKIPNTLWEVGGVFTYQSSWDQGGILSACSEHSDT